MNEQEVRSLVRAAVARHLGTASPADSVDPDCVPEPVQPIPVPLLSSHSLYTGLVNLGDACLIEPAVRCNHCGYCKTHGY